jgi:hypothetical protein
VKHGLVHLLSYTAGRSFSEFNPASRPSQEAVYQRIFDRDLESLGLQNFYYPVGFAANYGLLYIILRAAKTFTFRQVVELGAGQTTLLIDALRRAGILKADALTIEHDQNWATQIQASVSHSVLRVGLVNSKDTYANYEGYDLDAIAIPSDIDLLIIDGPPAGDANKKYARHSAMRLLDNLDPNGFLIIVDDCERVGEVALVERIDKYLRTKDFEFCRGTVAAAKMQSIFAARRLLGAAFF